MGRRTAKQLADSRRNIVAAAERLFAGKGFARTQVAEIARAAGVGIGAFYRQFSGKEELLSLILSGLFTDIRARVKAMRADIVQQTPLEQWRVIQQTFEIVFDVFASHPKVTLTMLRSGYGMSTKVEQMVWKSLNQLADDVAADVVKARGAGLLEISTPRYVGDVIVGMVLHLSHRMLVDRAFTAAEAARFCTRFTVGGLLGFAPPAAFQRIAPIVLELNACERQRRQRSWQP
ncbi:MAG: TetR/AcrR family transcriptional regulator [Nitrospirae bacterium]|nr:TetR/AcrR family transcriptional regulator [Nitrospirota bacterium]